MLMMEYIEGKRFPLKEKKKKKKKKKRKKSRPIIGSQRHILFSLSLFHSIFQVGCTRVF